MDLEWKRRYGGDDIDVYVLLCQHYPILVEWIMDRRRAAAGMSARLNSSNWFIKIQNPYKETKLGK